MTSTVELWILAGTRIDIFAIAKRYLLLVLGEFFAVSLIYLMASRERCTIRLPVHYLHYSNITHAML